MTGDDFSDKVVLVTGASRGIGRAIALAFGARGARVALAARTADLLEAAAGEIAASGGQAAALTCDMSVEEEVQGLVQAVVERFGSLDILVNNAAISPYFKRAEEMTTDMFREVLQVNLLSPFLLCREAGRQMMKRNWGRIINIASAGGLIALPRQSAYCASKGALIQMTKVLAVEWAAAYNITVNAIAPGYVATDLTAGVRASESISKSLLARNPSNRFGRPEEVAGAALYLASEEASFTTGTVLAVDGGMLSY